MTRNVISLTFDPAYPTQLPQADEIDKLVALAPGLRRRSSASPCTSAAPPRSATPVGLAAFSTWLQTAARRWPTITTWIAPNEPNQPRFWQPQFTAGCANASGAVVLPRPGDDVRHAQDGERRDRGRRRRPLAARQRHCAAPRRTSRPRRCASSRRSARRCGRSRRNRPIMDSISQHPYPLLNTHGPGDRLPLAEHRHGEHGPAQAGASGTRSRAPRSRRSSRVSTSTSTSSAGRPSRPARRTTGSENIPAIDEATQGRYYAQSIRMAACDPSVAALNFFHLLDEDERDRFQSGLLRADGSAKDSVPFVKAAIASARADGCAGVPGPLAARDGRPRPAVRPSAAKGIVRTVSLLGRGGRHLPRGDLPAGPQASIARALQALRASSLSSGTVKAYRTSRVLVPRTRARRALRRPRSGSQPRRTRGGRAILVSPPYHDPVAA